MSLREKIFVYFTAAWFAVLAGVNALIFEPMADGQKAPDAQPLGYSHDAVMGWASSLDANERSAFLLWHTRFLDFVFPILLMAALFVLLTASLRQFERFRTLPSWLRVALPVVLVAPYGLFDFLENGLVADMLRGEVPIDPVSVGLASSYTVLKFSFVGIAFAVWFGLWMVTGRVRAR
ncbi:MAG: hypothetical protein AAFY99_06050 [Pseudomonadota bacterium]